MASQQPPKKRHRDDSGGGGGLQEKVLKLRPKLRKYKSPHEMHLRVYTAYERDLRERLAEEDLLSIKCEFDAAEYLWVRTIDHALPAKSLAISRMSDSIDRDLRSSGIYHSPRPPRDDGQMPADLRILFAEETVTLASLFDMHFFTGMMRCAGKGRFGCALYLTAMAWVWAMFKLDFDPDGTPREENNGKHVMEQTRYGLMQDEILCKMHDEAVRKEFGDEGVAILNSSRP